MAALVLGLGSVYCHKSLAPCCNYNISRPLLGPLHALVGFTIFTSHRAGSMTTPTHSCLRIVHARKASPLSLVTVHVALMIETLKGPGEPGNDGLASSSEP